MGCGASTDVRARPSTDVRARDIAALEGKLWVRLGIVEGRMCCAVTRRGDEVWMGGATVQACLASWPVSKRFFLDFSSWLAAVFEKFSPLRGSHKFFAEF